VLGQRSSDHEAYSSLDLFAGLCCEQRSIAIESLAVQCHSCVCTCCAHVALRMHLKQSTDYTATPNNHDDILSLYVKRKTEACIRVYYASAAVCVGQKRQTLLTEGVPRATAAAYYC
jgi:hypothetical protein